MKTIVREGKAEPPIESLVSWQGQRYGGLGFGKPEVKESREIQ